MGWTVTPAGSWSVAVTDTPSTMAGALALPGSWPVGQQPELFVRSDQVVNLPSAGPPVAGYLAWYDATAITGVADGATLSTWPDGSGNGNTLNATATPATYYKTTSAKLVNGKPAVWMAAGGYSLQVASNMTVGSPATVVAVFQGSGGNITLWDHGSNDTYAFGKGLDAGTGYAMSAGAPLFDGVAVDANLHFMVAVFNGASSTIQRDATTVSGNSGVFSISAQRPRVGFSSAGTAPLCELLLYPSALNSTQRNSLRSYAQSKWGTP